MFIDFQNGTKAVRKLYRTKLRVGPNGIVSKHPTQRSCILFLEDHS